MVSNLLKHIEIVAHATEHLQAVVLCAAGKRTETCTSVWQDAES